MILGSRPERLETSAAGVTTKFKLACVPFGLDLSHSQPVAWPLSMLEIAGSFFSHFHSGISF
jgi:hypothetical protein